MANVVFVAPFLMGATLRFIDAVAATPDVRLVVVSQDDEGRIPEALRAKLSGHYRVKDGMSREELRLALDAVRSALGSIDCLLGTLEQLQVTLGELREELHISGMGSAVARAFRDKSHMKRLFQRAGVACARFRLVDDSQSLRAFAKEVGFPLVVKPPAGAGAQSTFRLDDEAALEGYLETMPPDGARPCLAEEFLSGQEYSFDSVLVDGEILWYSIHDYAPTPLEVLREPWIQWCVLSRRELDIPEYRGIRDAATQALSALGLEHGMTHMEWFRRSDGSLAISEVAARPPGAQFVSIASYAHDTDLYRGWAELMVHERFSPPARDFAAGAAFLRAQGRGASVRGVRGLEEVASSLGELVVESKLPKPGQRPTGGYEGDGYVIVRDPKTPVVEDALATLVSTLRVELG